MQIPRFMWNWPQRWGSDHSSSRGTAGSRDVCTGLPDKTPSFAEYPELFYGLWEDGIQRQKNYRVIWNIGFRGQGDRPFWDDDPQYDTPKKRGDLISSLMVRQYELVKKHVEESCILHKSLWGDDGTVSAGAS